MTQHRHAIALSAGALPFLAAALARLDPDYFWHLATGRLIWSTRAVPAADPFSYTAAGAPWLAHEWLAEVLFAGLDRLAGTTGPIVLALALVWLAIVAAWLRTRATGGGVAADTLCLIVVPGALLPFLGPRPALFSWCFAALLLLWLDRAGPPRPRGWLAIGVLFAVWANVHAGVVVGLGLLGLAATTDLLTGNRRDAPAWLGGLAVATTATLLTPHGLALWAYPWATLASPAMRAIIAEWQSPDFHLVALRPFEALLLVLVIGPGRLGGLGLGERLRLGVLAALALESSRNAPLFLLLAGPTLARAVPAVPWPDHWQRRQTPIAIGVALLALAGTAILVAPAHLQASEDARYPAAALAVVAARPAGETRLFAEYHWGGYAIAGLFPHWRVAIDGRADVYGDAQLTRYVRITRLVPGWEDQWQAVAPDVALVTPASPLAAALPEVLHWRVAYRDDQAVVLAPD